jgi:hypothetical protein
MGGTVATLKRSGWEIWTFLGTLTSAIIFLAVVLTVRKWRKKIEELKDDESAR